MGDMAVQNDPEPLDLIKTKAIGQQLEQMNATIFARHKRSDIGAFAVWVIVLNDVNDTFVKGF